MCDVAGDGRKFEVDSQGFPGEQYADEWRTEQQRAYGKEFEDEILAQSKAT